MFHRGCSISPALVSGFCGCFLSFSDSCRTGESREFLSYPMQLIRKHSSLCRLVGNVSRLFSDANREQTLQTK